MKTDVNTRTDVQMTAQEVSEKFNGGKKVIDFVGKKKIWAKELAELDAKQ